MFKVTISARGQLVIPAEVRRRLGLKSGTQLRVYDSQGKITLVPEVEDPVDTGLGFLRKEKDRTEASAGEERVRVPGSV